MKESSNLIKEYISKLMKEKSINIGNISRSMASFFWSAHVEILENLTNIYDAHAA